MAKAQANGQLEHFRELLDGFSNAMLVTRCPDGELRSRPMAVAERDPDGGIWFVSDVEAGKIAEIAHDPKVNVTLQSDMTWVSVSGEARIVRDRERMKRLWQESWRVWFPNGPEDSDLVLMHVQPHRAEYWDNRGTRGLRFLFDAARHYLSGQKKGGEEEPEQHGKIELQ